MNYGFIKVAAATPEIRVADCAYNTEAVLSLWKEADALGCHLVAFPELVLTGSTCGDLFLHKTLLDGALAGLKKLVEESNSLNSIGIIGMPLIHQGKLYNCAVTVQKGNVLSIVPKTILTSHRQFTSAPEQNTVYSDALYAIGMEETLFGPHQVYICEGMKEFTFSVGFEEDFFSPLPLSASHAMAGANIVVCLSANNEQVGRNTYLHRMIEAQSTQLTCGYVFSNIGAGESTTDYVYSGHNMIAENGEILAECKAFSTGLTISEIDVAKLVQERLNSNAFPLHKNDKGYYTVWFDMDAISTTLTRNIDSMPFIPSNEKELAERCELILTMQAEGLKKRIVHSYANTAVIGISGGLDSTLALLVAAKAMDLLNRPRTDIVAVTMPCFGTTSRTRSNAEILCQELGVTFRTVDIGNTVKAHFADIGHDFNDHSVTFENGQARERTQVLMDIANQVNGLVVGTGDLSELALGWATYNGDHMSMYGVNGSIPKTLVRHIVRHVANTSDNMQLKTVLLDILDTPVSPELLPANDGEIAQKTEDLVGPYELHDFFLYNAIRWAYSPKKIYYLAQQAFKGQYDDATILHWLRTFFRRFFTQQFKRSCLPDGVAVGSVGLSPRGGWQMPSDAVSALWLAEIDSLS